MNNDIIMELDKLIVILEKLVTTMKDSDTYYEHINKLKSYVNNIIISKKNNIYDIADVCIKLFAIKQIHHEFVDEVLTLNLIWKEYITEIQKIRTYIMSNYISKNKKNYEKIRDSSLFSCIMVNHIPCVSDKFTNEILKRQMEKDGKNVEEIDLSDIISGIFDACVCGQYGEYICLKCKNKRYCSSECQKKDWIIHKKECLEIIPTFNLINENCDSNKLYLKSAGNGKFYDMNKLLEIIHPNSYIVLSSTYFRLNNYKKIKTHGTKIINCKNIQNYIFEDGLKVPDEDIIIIDECGFFGEKCHDLLYAINGSGKKLICYGDFDQFLNSKDKRPYNQPHYLKYLFGEIDISSQNYIDNFIKEKFSNEQINLLTSEFSNLNHNNKNEYLNLQMILCRNDLLNYQNLCILFEQLDLMERYEDIITMVMHYPGIIINHYEVTSEIFRYNIEHKWIWDLNKLTSMSSDQWKMDLFKSQIHLCSILYLKISDVTS